MTPRTLRNALLGAALATTSVALAQTSHGDSAPATMGDAGTMGGMHAHPTQVAITRHLDVAAGAHGIPLPDMGVEIVAIRLSAAGGLLDLRYRVLDPAKAKSITDAALPISVFDPGSGTSGAVPVDEQVGSLQQSGHQIRPGQTMAALFANPNRAIGKGGKINLRIGDLEIMGLTVEG